MARGVLASRWVWGINFIKSQQDLWMERMYNMREGKDNLETEGLGMGWVLEPSTDLEVKVKEGEIKKPVCFGSAPSWKALSTASQIFSYVCIFSQTCLQTKA